MRVALHVSLSSGSAQDFDFFAETDDERVTNMQDVDKLAELLSADR